MSIGNSTMASVTWLLLASLPLAAAPPVGDSSVERRVGSRRVYVPIEDLDVILSRDKQGVLLPRAEFIKLQALARTNAATRPRPPAPLVLTDVNYVARIDGDHLLIEAAIRFRQFATGWQVLRLPLRGVSIEAATLDGQPARIGRLRQVGKTAVSGLELLNDQPGTRTLELVLSTPLASLGSDKVAAFGLVPASTATLTVALPVGKHLLLDGLSVRRPAAADEPAEYRLAVGGKAEVRLTVTDRQAERTGDVLVFATTGFGVNVAPGEVTWQASTSLEIFGQPRKQLTATVPKNLEITDVSSSGLQGWELADDVNDADRTRITLDYRQPFTGSRRIVFRGVMTTKVGQAWRVPRLMLPGVTSHVGRVLIKHPPGVRVQLVTARGVRRGGAPSAGVAADSLKFDVWREDFDLVFATETKLRELQAAVTTILDIDRGGLSLAVEATVESLFAPLFELDLSLPVDWNVSSVQVGGREVAWKWLPPADGRRALRITLAKALPAGTEAKVMLTARRRLAGWPLASVEPREVPLPDVRLAGGAAGTEQQGTMVVEGAYFIKAADEFDVVPVAFSGLDPASKKVGGSRLGYTYQDARIEGRLRLSRKPLRLSAETLTVTRLDRDTLFAHLEARLQIEGGGTRTLSIRLPESAGSDLRFTLSPSTVRIVEQLPGDVIDIDGKRTRTWALRLDQFVRGSVLLAVDVTSPLKDGGAGFEPPVLRVLDAERQNGFLAVEAAGDQRLTVIATDQAGRKLSPVDPIDLPETRYVPRERIVKAYRYLVPDYVHVLKRRQFDHESVLTAVCHAGDVTSILDRTGEFQHRTRFVVTATGVQSLVVDLGGSAAEGSTSPKPWAVLIDGKPIKARTTPDGRFAVTWPDDEGTPRPHTLDVFFSTRQGSLAWSGDITQHSPRLLVVEGIGGEPQQIEILKQAWTIHHPVETALVDSRGRFDPVGPLDRDSLLGSLQQGFAVDSPTAMLLKAVVILGIVGGLVVITLAYRRRRVVGLVAATVVLLAIGMVGTVVLVVSSVTSSRPFAYSTPGDGVASGDDLSVFREEAVPEGARFGRSTGSESDPQVSRGIGGGIGGGMGGGGGMGLVADLEAPDKSDRLGVANSNGVIDQLADAAKEEIARRTKTNRTTTAQTQAQQRPESKQPFGPNADAPKTAGRSPSRRPASPPVAKPGADSDLDSKVSDAPRNAPTETPGFELLPPGVPALATAGALQPTPGDSREGMGEVLPQGRLSLALELNTNLGDGWTRREFRYVGRNTASAGLELSYQDRLAQVTYRLVCLTALLLAAWLFRRRSLGERAIAVTVGLVVPLALVPIVPVGWYVWLDGLFLGALAATALWTLRSLLGVCDGWLRRVRGWWPGPLARFVGLILFAAVLLGAVTAATAQQPKAAAPKSKAAEIIVPFDPAGDPLAAPRVLVPRAEFLRLWNLAHPDRPVQPPAPVEGLVASADYTAAAAGVARVSVTGRLVLYSFRNRQVVVPLPLGAVALASAQLDGRPAPILTRTTRGGRPLTVVLRKPGRHLLVIRFDVPLVRNGPAGQFVLPLQAVPVGRLAFRLPADNLQLRVNGSSTLFRRARDDEGERIDVPINAGGPVRIAWQPRQARDVAEDLVQLESHVEVELQDAGVRRTSAFRFRVRQGDLPEVTFELPPKLHLKRVSGPDVGGWELLGEDVQRRLRVFFRRRVDDATRVSLETFQDTRVSDDDVTIELTAIGVAGFERDNGLVAVFAGEQFGLRGIPTGTMKQVGQAEFKRPGWLTSGGGTAGRRAASSAVGVPRVVFRTITRPFELSLVVSRRAPQSVATARHGLQVGTRKTKIASRIRWQLSRAPRSRVSLELPGGYLPIDVKATDLADWYLPESADGSPGLLTIEFGSPLTGTIDVELAGVVPRTPEALNLSLAVPVPLDCNRLDSQLAVWLDDSYTAKEASLGDWRSIGRDQLDATLRRLDTRPVGFSFRSSVVGPAPPQLQLLRAKPQLTANVVSIITVTDTLTDFSLALSWKIQRAAADTFRFTTPDWLAGLRFRDPRVREARAEPQDDGKLVWTIRLQDPVRDRYFVIAQLTRPPHDPSVGDEGARLDAPEVRFLEPGDGNQPLEAQAQGRYVLLINQSGRRLTRQPDSSEEVQQADLPIKVDQRLVQQATELLRVPLTPPRWKVSVPEREFGVGATVNLADLKSVFSPDGSWRTQATYLVRNQFQQFMAVRLPDDKSQVLSVFVQGRASRPVSPPGGPGNVILVALPIISQADRSFTVRIVFAGQLDGGDLAGGLRLWARQIDLPVPDVISDKDDKDFGQYAVDVKRTEWAVYLPKDLDVSVVEDRDRTNLKPDSANQGMAAALLEEATTLANLVEGTASGKSKSRAAGNLKQLNVELEEQRRYYSSRTDRKLQGAIIQENQEVQSRLERVLGQRDLDETRGTVELFDSSENMRFQSEMGQQAYIDRNNDALTTSNFFAPPVDPKSGAAEGRFRFGTASPAASEKSKDGKRGSRRARGGKGGGALGKSRDERRQQSLEQAAGLNQALESKKQVASPLPTGQAASRVRPGAGNQAAFKFAGERDQGVGPRAGQQQLFESGGEVAAVAGGLSVPIEIIDPNDETLQMLSFARLQGRPMLALALRPRKSVETGVSLAWTLAWLLVGTGTVIACRRPGTWSLIRRHLPKGLVALGLVGFFLVPGLGEVIGFVLFFTGAIWLAIQQRSAE